jgi:hypothetical protein
MFSLLEFVPCYRIQQTPGASKETVAIHPTLDTRTHIMARREIKNTFSWSVSRDSVLRECHRKYYFRYYGHWGGWERETAPERTRQAYVLGKLGTIPTWIGQVVHECIARSLRNFSRGAPVLSVEEILSITRNRMRSNFRDSRAKRYWTNPKEYYGLFEHEYDAEVSDAEWKEAADTVDSCLMSFYKSETFGKLRTLKADDYLEVEQSSTCQFEDVMMRIKLDCATREGNNVAIWDWKTGKREGATGLSLQMACYAWYAQQAFKVPLQHVITRRYDLYHDNIYEQMISGPELNEILAYVRGSIKDMQGLLENVKENVAVEERFQKVERPNVCLRCNFLKVCQPDI